MNWMAAYEQKEDALLRVFFMLIASFLLTIRAGLGSRAAYVLLPVEGAPHADAAEIDTSTPDADFLCRALMLLCAIELVRRRLAALMVRAVYELMNLAHALTNPAQAGKPTSQYARPAERLDSS